jgi:sulfate transport system permease protein
MAIVVPDLEIYTPPSPAAGPKKPSLVSRVLGSIIPLIACLYVGLVILTPALSVVAQAFAKGVQPFLQNLSSPSCFRR